MSTAPFPINSEADYTPEFKSKVVLEYVRNPKRKQRIVKENGISEQLLLQWHQEFLERASQIFGDPQSASLPAKTESNIAETSVQKQEIALPAPAWGIRFNKNWHSSYSSPSSSKDPPNWLGRSGKSEWQKRGVVVWDEGSRNMEVLTADEALHLLDNLRERGYWRTNGIPISKRGYKIKLPERLNAKDKRKEKEAKERTEHEKNKWEPVEKVRFHLDPRVGEEVFGFLQEHEPLLKELAVEQEKEATERYLAALKILFGSMHEQEAEEIDLRNRRLKWTHETASHSFVCNRRTDRATVNLDDTGLFWQACIERPEQFKHWSNHFGKLEEVLGWAEQELLTPQVRASRTNAQKTKKDTRAEQKSKRARIDLTPFRIKPAQLEPKQLTFRVIIELNHASESFKTMEMSFGKLWRYDETFPSPTQVVRDLRIDPVEVDVEQLLGPNDDWNRIRSAAVYYQSDVAKAQVQKMWSQSTIHALYKEGKIRRARYGFEEVETHYCHWLGGLNDPEHPWEQSSRRAKHMADLAMRETLAYALDVDGFREFLELSTDGISDHRLLIALHRTRAQSEHIPKAERVKSQKWLKQHGTEKDPE
jgi:transposase-like protein